MGATLFARLLRATERGAFPALRRGVWRGAYGTLSRAWRRPRWGFLNYGYLPPGPPPPLEPEDEPDRAFIGLYHQAVAGLPLTGARVLEVGCGHGGGAAFLARRAGALVTGVDRSVATLRVARRMGAGVPGLAFRTGDAEALDLPDGSFDVVVNIESSHCYGRMERFVAEAARVLRPGGWLTWADMRSPAMLPALDRAFARPDLTLMSEAVLNEGVLAALDAMDAAKEAEIAPYGPLRPLLREFAGMRGSRLRAALRDGGVLYLARRYRRG